MTTERPKSLRSNSWLKYKATPRTTSYILSHVIPGAGMLAQPREVASPARRSTNEVFEGTTRKAVKKKRVGKAGDLKRLKGGLCGSI